MGGSAFSESADVSRRQRASDDSRLLIWHASSDEYIRDEAQGVGLGGLSAAEQISERLAADELMQVLLHPYLPPVDPP